MDSEHSFGSDDETDIARVRSGDVDAFEGLIDRHKQHVARVISRNVPPAQVEELAHETFVAAYTSLPSYRPTHPFEHWLTRIALRACSEFWRREYRDRDRRSVTLEEAPPAASVADEESQRELLAWALDQLELENRQVITLVYFEDLSVKEAAELLGWSQAKVKVRTFRARKLLREILERALPELRNES